jgi:hypothetical protein
MMLLVRRAGKVRQDVQPLQRFGVCALGRGNQQLPGLVGDPACAHALADELAHLRQNAVLCSTVFADQAAEDLPALDPGGHVDGAAGLAQRRFLLQALVRPWPL